MPVHTSVSFLLLSVSFNHFAMSFMHDQILFLSIVNSDFLVVGVFPHGSSLSSFYFLPICSVRKSPKKSLKISRWMCSFIKAD